jgi:signal transduction histidine kinase
MTVLQGEAETVLMKRGATKEDYERVIHSSLQEIEKMNDIVSTVEQLSEEEKNLEHFQPTQINLVHWLHENKMEWEKTLGRSLTMNIVSSSTPLVFLSAKILFRLVDNLVRNVKEHTPCETECNLRLASNRESLTLSVCDDGPGIKPNEEGVGIHLCQQIAKISNLKLSFFNQKPKGLEVRIDFTSSLV